MPFPIQDVPQEPLQLDTVAIFGVFKNISQPGFRLGADLYRLIRREIMTAGFDSQQNIHEGLGGMGNRIRPCFQTECP